MVEKEVIFHNYQIIFGCKYTKIDRYSQIKRYDTIHRKRKRTVAITYNFGETKGAQIDLLIDRRDEVINLCEMKFSTTPFAINKSYAANLNNKIQVFKEEVKNRKAVHLTMITTFGVKQNSYSHIVHRDLTMDILFD